jgi:hypothetical protein
MLCAIEAQVLEMPCRLLIAHATRHAADSPICGEAANRIREVGCIIHYTNNTCVAC